MIILVLDPWLDALLASAALIAQLWPTAAEDIMLIFGALRLAGTTLADTLQNGLVRTLEPIRGAAESQIMLACGQAVLSGFAAGRDGEAGTWPAPAGLRRMPTGGRGPRSRGVSALSRAAG